MLDLFHTHYTHICSDYSLGGGDFKSHTEIARYVPIPKMDDYRPSITIQNWMIFSDHAKIIQFWMMYFLYRDVISSIIIQFWMFYAIHFWMIY